MITKNGKKVSARKWVLETAYLDVDLMTDYYYERESEEWDKMTEKEQAAISAQYDKLHDRIKRMIAKAKGGS